MPVKIRLKRIGAKKNPVYRVVVANSTCSRDGKFIDTVGHYDPCKQPPTLHIDEAKAQKWLSHGAQPTDTTRALLKKLGILDRFEAAKVEARQNK